LEILNKIYNNQIVDHTIVYFSVLPGGLVWKAFIL